MPHPTVASAVALKQLAPNIFKSLHTNEGQGGGGRNMGYGGFTIAFGLNAAWASLSPSQHHLRLYSCLGTFLGPSSTSEKLTATITSLRDTRTFATRHVLISQPQSDGSARNIMSLTADFMRPEPASFVKYAVRPMRSYSAPESEGSLTWDRIEAAARKAGVEDLRIKYEKNALQHFSAKYEQRSPKEGFGGQSAKSMLPISTELPMDVEEPSAKSQAEWYRPRAKVGSYIDALVNIPYILDSRIAADAGDLNRLNWTYEAAAISSLEFALRVYVNELDFQNWILRENRLVAAGGGRTFQEAFLFDREGNALAQLSEQCVLRPKKEFAKL